jgi:steroid delta-isomerase-like uncharacterized protein
MERDELIRRAHRVMAAWGDRDPMKLSLFYAPDCTTRESGQPVLAGRAGVILRAQQYFRASIDLDIRMRSVNCDGNTTFSRWTLRGTHTGPLFGVAPTGKRVDVEGCTAHEWTSAGYVQHETLYWDRAQILRTLGALAVALG